jgi:hypothetical protein
MDRWKMANWLERQKSSSGLQPALVIVCIV